MAHPLATITGKIRKPDGTALGPGTLYLSLNVRGSVDDDTTSDKYEVQGTDEIAIDANGDLSFSVTPNDLISPAASFYDAIYIFAGFKREERLTITGATAQDLADLVRS